MELKIGSRILCALHSLMLWRLPTPTDAIAFAAWEADALGSWCSRCGVSLRCSATGADGACAECRGRQFAYHAVTRLGSYHDPLDVWVRMIKSRGWKAMAEHLGMMLAARAPPVDIVVPVPMHRIRREVRGIDHAGELARAIAVALDVPVCYALTQKLAARQMGASRTARLLNTQRFQLSRAASSLAGARIALVDDVRTTGSTLQSAAAQLRDVGVTRIEALVVAVRDPVPEEEDL